MNHRGQKRGLVTWPVKYSKGHQDGLAMGSACQPRYGESCQPQASISKTVKQYLESLPASLTGPFLQGSGPGVLLEGRAEDEKDSPRGPQPWPEAPQGPSTPNLTLGPDLRPKGRDTGAGAMLAPGLHTPLRVGERTGL